MHTLFKTDLGVVKTISAAEYEKLKHLLPPLQREWDNDVLSRYDAGLLGGLSALTPRIVAIVRRGKRMEMCTLLVAGVTAGSHLWEPMALALEVKLTRLGLPAKYDSTIEQEVPLRELQERAALEIEALRTRVSHPLALSPAHLAWRDH